MNVPQHAVIAAAGFGSRLNQGIPKCLVEIMGRKLIEYQLALLQAVPDVRVVTGYHAEEVERFVKALRPDVRCIHNDQFAHTSTLQSYYRGCHDIRDFFILIDGDIIPHKDSFRTFLSGFSGDNMIGISPAATEDAVFVHTNEARQITGFSRAEASPYEWSNIAVLHSDLLTDEPIYVYQCLERHLPLEALAVERLEIDTAADMEYALDAMRKTAAYIPF